jgi:hypothetical protein
MPSKTNPKSETSVLNLKKNIYLKKLHEWKNLKNINLSFRKK